MPATSSPSVTPVLTQAQTPPGVEQRRTVRGYILFTILILLALGLAWRLREVLQLVYVSALFAVVLMPVVKRIEDLRIGKYKPSRFVAIIALMLSVVLLLFLLFFFGLPPVLRDIEHFTSDLPQRVPEIVARAKRVPLLDKLGVENIAQRGEAAAASVAGYLVSSAPSGSVTSSISQRRSSCASTSCWKASQRISIFWPWCPLNRATGCPKHWSLPRAG